MKLSVVVNCHENSLTLKDTLDSISCYLSKDILLVCDSYKKDEFKDIKNVYKIDGLIHNYSKSPYKNVALGLFNAYQIWNKNVDWYCYIEPDCLISKNNILQDLQQTDAWMCGNNLRSGKLSDKNIFIDGKIAFIEKIINKTLDDNFYYMLGCCVFFKNEFLEKLVQLDFFNKFIFFTNSLYSGNYINYRGYDISEHLYPTLCYNLGGKIKEFANFDNINSPNGDYKKYYMRFRPELGLADFEICKNSYIMHPLKSHDNLRVLMLYQ